jgi:hypothetical protein
VGRCFLITCDTKKINIFFLLFLALDVNSIAEPSTAEYNISAPAGAA